MAVILMKQWRLATLRVQLDLSDVKAAVLAEALGYPDDSQDEATTLWSRRYRLSAFGLKATRPRNLKVPQALGAAVRDAFGDAELSTLWLHLVPPYGYLGAAPWEASSFVPMLRVPDRLPAPAAKLGRVWRTVLVISATPGSTWPAPYVDSFTTNLAKRVDGPVEVDVFADAGTASALARDSLSESVRVHDPTDAKVAVGARASSTAPAAKTAWKTAAQLWPAWIASGLRGQAVRAVHVVLDGAFDESRPVLAIHPDPGKPVSRSGSAFVTGDEVLALTDAIGADVLSFGSPPDNPSDFATRMIADGVGQKRAGTTLYSALGLDRTGMRLVEAHAAIRHHGAWPHHPSLFAYLQPEHTVARPAGERTLETIREPEARSFDLSQPNTELEQIYSNSDSVPSWVAASDRYLSNQLAGLAQQAVSSIPTAQIKGAYNKGATDAIAMLRDIVDRNAEPT
jgi:hypothetical protein